MFENCIAHNFERKSGLAECTFDTDLVNRLQADFGSPSMQDLLQKQREMAAVDIAQELECVVVDKVEDERRNLQN